MNHFKILILFVLLQGPAAIAVDSMDSRVQRYCADYLINMPTGLSAKDFDEVTQMLSVLTLDHPALQRAFETVGRSGDVDAVVKLLNSSLGFAIPPMAKSGLPGQSRKLFHRFYQQFLIETKTYFNGTNQRTGRRRKGITIRRKLGDHSVLVQELVSWAELLNDRDRLEGVTFNRKINMAEFLFFSVKNIVYRFSAHTALAGARGELGSQGKFNFEYQFPIRFITPGGSYGEQSQNGETSYRRIRPGSHPKVYDNFYLKVPDVPAFSSNDIDFLNELFQKSANIPTELLSNDNDIASYNSPKFRLLISFIAFHLHEIFKIRQDIFTEFSQGEQTAQRLLVAIRRQTENRSRLRERLSRIQAGQPLNIIVLGANSNQLNLPAAVTQLSNQRANRINLTPLSEIRSRFAPVADRGVQDYYSISNRFGLSMEALQWISQVQLHLPHPTSDGSFANWRLDQANLKDWAGHLGDYLRISRERSQSDISEILSARAWIAEVSSLVLNYNNGLIAELRLVQQGLQANNQPLSDENLKLTEFVLRLIETIHATSSSLDHIKVGVGLRLQQYNYSIEQLDHLQLHLQQFVQRSSLGVEADDLAAGIVQSLTRLMGTQEAPRMLLDSSGQLLLTAPPRTP